MHNTSTTNSPLRKTLLALAIGAMSQGALAADGDAKKTGRTPWSSGPKNTPISTPAAMIWFPPTWMDRLPTAAAWGCWENRKQWMFRSTS